MTRRHLIALVVALAAFAVVPASASASAFLPPPGKIWHGVAGGHHPGAFVEQTGKRPAIFQLFVAWNNADWAFGKGDAAGGRLMLHLSTYRGPGTREIITPAQIAAGRGDAFLLRLNRRIAERGQPLYLRLFAEMNGHWNPYCAFDASGRARPGHSTRQFRRAWRRIAVILRGGAGVDAKLRRLGMSATGHADLPRAPVSLLWVPQVAGAPDTRANAPRAYWPGGRYVDWVGTDFYSKFPNWSGLERFFRAFPGKPFAFGEYAVWGRDDPGFVRRIFAWSKARPRVKMLIYNQGVKAAGPFRLRHYPRARRALRALLASPRFPGAR